jgi:hypothetical protein
VKNLYYFLFVLVVFNACKQSKTATDILQKSIAAIDTVETISYKQNMWRTNPRNTDDTIQRFREMVFKRLVSDSIVGVKGHWNMYLYDKKQVMFEDIYDGQKLIRKNNRDSIAAVYDLVKYPKWHEIHFWSHNTLFAIQHEFKTTLKHKDKFKAALLNDTIFNGTACYQVEIKLEDYTTMPGFAMKLDSAKGVVICNKYFIDQSNFYPIGIHQISYNKSEPEKQYFFNQNYYDIKFNLPIDKQQFNTSIEMLEGFNIREMQP